MLRRLFLIVTLPCACALLLAVTGCGASSSSSTSEAAQKVEAERQAERKAQERRRRVEQKRQLRVAKWQGKLTRVRSDLSIAADTIYQEITETRLNVPGGSYAPERISEAYDTLWNCAYHVELIGPVPKRIKYRKQRALGGCRYYREAYEAYNEFWKSGNYGAWSNGLGLAMKGDAAFGQSGSAGYSGGSSGSGYGGGDLDCADIDGPVIVDGSDPNNFDADGDGIGCE